MVEHVDAIGVVDVIAVLDKVVKGDTSDVVDAVVDVDGIDEEEFLKLRLELDVALKPVIVKPVKLGDVDNEPEADDEDANTVVTSVVKTVVAFVVVVTTVRAIWNGDSVDAVELLCGGNQLGSVVRHHGQLLCERCRTMPRSGTTRISSSPGVFGGTGFVAAGNASKVR